jgi:hypothetical protein
MENISRGHFGFCHYSHRGVNAVHHSCKTTEYKSTDSPIHAPSFKCNVLRKSHSVDSQNISCATLKRRGSWVISVYLWALPLLARGEGNKENSIDSKKS